MSKINFDFLFVWNLVSPFIIEQDTYVHNSFTVTHVKINTSMRFTISTYKVLTLYSTRGPYICGRCRKGSVRPYLIDHVFPLHVITSLEIVEVFGGRDIQTFVCRQ